MGKKQSKCVSPGNNPNDDVNVEANGTAASREKRIHRVPKFVEDKAEFVQITPSLQTTPEASVVFQAGRYSSTWVRVRDETVSSRELNTLITEAEELRKGPIYVGLPERIAGNYLLTVLERGLTFHHYHRSTGELVYYRWVKPESVDMVPAYATSIQGGGAIVLSPNERNVLLVYEYGRWGRSGGAVDPGESCLETALREISEELPSVQLDLDGFPPQLALAYDQPKSRDGIVNDCFFLFVVRHATTDSTIFDRSIKEFDHKELSAARWFVIDELVTAWRDVKSGFLTDDGMLPMHVELFEDEFKRNFGCMELLAIEKFVEGKCLPVQRVRMNRTTPCLMF